MKKQLKLNNFLIDYFGQYSTPTPFENQVLIKQILNGETYLRWELVCRNWRYIMFIIQNRYKYPLDEDTFIDGLLGFYEATLHINEDSFPVAKFYEYAAKCIYTKIQRGYNYRQQQVTIDSNSKIKNNIKISQFSLDKLDNPDESSLKNRLYNPLDLDPCEHYTVKDTKNLYYTLIQKILTMKMTGKQAQIFLSLVKNGGQLTLTAKECKIAKQRVHFVKSILVEKIQEFLKVFHPKIYQEMLDLVNNK